MHRTVRRALGALAIVGSLGVQAAVGQPTTVTPSQAVEPRALDLLKAMNTKLAAAQSFSFRARSTNEGPDKTSPFLAVLGDAEVAVMRPDKLRARIRGASPPFDLYFDGARMTAYQPTLNVYATTEASKAVAVLIPFALQNAGILLPLADVLYGDSYAAIMRNITRARYKGVSAVGGNRCHHAAFAGPSAEWETWIDARTSLPCRVTGTLLEMKGAPRFAVDFSDWKLNPQLSAASFVFAKPAGAAEMDFRALMGQ